MSEAPHVRGGNGGGDGGSARRWCAAADGNPEDRATGYELPFFRSRPTPDDVAPAMRELGYWEGKNIAFESRFGEGKPDQLRRFAAELVGLKVDIIVTSGTPATQAAKQLTRTTPIVMTNNADPVAAGLVASLARPGANVTGLTTQDADLGGKRLELLLQVVPRISHLALLIDETNPGTVLIAKGTQAAAASLGMQVQSFVAPMPGRFRWSVL